MSFFYERSFLRIYISQFIELTLNYKCGMQKNAVAGKSVTAFFIYGRKHVRPFQRRTTVRLYECYVISMSVFYRSRCCLLLF